MNTNENISEKAIVEVNEILKYLATNIKEKIPTELIKNFNNVAKDSTYKFSIDKKRKLKEQEISKQGKALISALYLKYCCNQERKEELLNICKQNEIQQLKRYDVNKIFDNKSDIKNEIKNEQLPVEVKKGGFFRKIFNKIKQFLGISSKKEEY